MSLRLWPQTHQMPPVGAECAGAHAEQRAASSGGLSPTASRVWCRAEALVQQHPAGKLGTDPSLPWVLSPRQCVCLLLSSRPPDLGGPPPKKAVLSMNGLSFGVIRVDTEEKLSVLTVQDVGQVLPGGKGRAAVCPVSQLLDVTGVLSAPGFVGVICKLTSKKLLSSGFPCILGF